MDVCFRKNIYLTKQFVNGNLEEKHRNHKWHGSYKKFQDIWECHIKPDWILLYKIEEGILYLISNGSHSDFKI